MTTLIIPITLDEIVYVYLLQYILKVNTQLLKTKIYNIQ